MAAGRGFEPLVQQVRRARGQLHQALTKLGQLRQLGRTQECYLPQRGIGIDGQLLVYRAEVAGSGGPAGYGKIRGVVRGGYGAFPGGRGVGTIGGDKQLPLRCGRAPVGGQGGQGGVQLLPGFGPHRPQGLGIGEGKMQLQQRGEGIGRLAQAHGHGQHGSRALGLVAVLHNGVSGG